MKKLCVIAARGGSKGVPGKNIRMLINKPVIAWAIEKAFASQLFDRVVVSTDSKKIADIAQSLGAEIPFIRPPELSDSEAGKFQVWQHALNACEEYYDEQYDVYVDLDCTNPLIEVQDIKNAFAQFIESRKKGIDAIFTVSPARRNPYFNLVEPDENNALKMSKSKHNKVLCRQNAPLVYEHIAGIYILTPGYLRSANHLLDGYAEGYEIPEGKSLDIDSEFDFEIIEYLMQKKYGSIANENCNPYVNYTSVID